MTTVEELQPGDVVSIPSAAAMGLPSVGLFVGASQHPKYPSLRLVIWLLSNGTWSLDALSPKQEIGAAHLATPMDRLAALKRWLDVHWDGDDA